MLGIRGEGDGRGGIYATSRGGLSDDLNVEASARVKSEHTGQAASAIAEHVRRGRAPPAHPTCGSGSLSHHHECGAEDRHDIRHGSA